MQESLQDLINISLFRTINPRKLYQGFKNIFFVIICEHLLLFYFKNILHRGVLYYFWLHFHKCGSVETVLGLLKHWQMNALRLLGMKRNWAKNCSDVSAWSRCFIRFPHPLTSSTDCVYRVILNALWEKKKHNKEHMVLSNFHVPQRQKPTLLESKKKHVEICYFFSCKNGNWVKKLE